MALNTIQTFNIKGSQIVSLYGTIMKLQRLHRAESNIKIMLADNSDNLQAAVEAIRALPEYETDPEATLNAKYDVAGYRLNEAQVPPTASVEQIRAIRAFINA